MDENKSDLRAPKKKLGDEEDSNVSEHQDDNKAIESASATQSFDDSDSDKLEIVDNEIETEQHEVDPEGETSQGEKLLVCPTCSKTFKGRDLNYRLKSHMITHTKERPFECKICGKKFTRKDHLNKHVRIHSGDKPFKCKFCDYASADAGDLVRHERIHSGEKPFECPGCGNRFTRSHHLHDHMNCCTGTKSAEAGPSTSSSNQKDN